MCMSRKIDNKAMFVIQYYPTKNKVLHSNALPNTIIIIIINIINIQDLYSAISLYSAL